MKARKKDEQQLQVQQAEALVLFTAEHNLSLHKVSEDHVPRFRSFPAVSVLKNQNVRANALWKWKILP